MTFIAEQPVSFTVHSPVLSNTVPGRLPLHPSAPIPLRDRLAYAEPIAAIKNIKLQWLDPHLCSLLPTTPLRFSISPSIRICGTHRTLPGYLESSVARCPKPQTITLAPSLPGAPSICLSRNLAGSASISGLAPVVPKADQTLNIV